MEGYESDNMKLVAEGVLGICYLLTRSNSTLSGTQNLSNESLGNLKLTKIELYLNMRIQTFLVQKIGVVGVSKYTFNEITLAELSSFTIGKKDFESNDADPRFKYCFSI